MTRLQKLSLTSLLIGLVLAAFVVPWSLSKIGHATDTIKQYQQVSAEAAALPAVDPQTLEASRALAQERAQTQKLAAEQAARIKAELEKVAIPGPTKPVVAFTPNPAYSIVPQGSPQLIPLEGWVDQPNKTKPGKVHTNLMLRNVKPSLKTHVEPRAPCLKPVRRPAERVERPYGWLAVPARTILVPCGS